MGYLPGYVATITIAGVPVNDDASDVTYSLITDAIGKTPLGQTNRVYVNGLQDATLTATLHMSTENANALAAAQASTVPVAYVVRPGSLGALDVGQWSGVGIITAYDPTGSAEGEWDVAITLQGSGDRIRTDAA